MRGSLSPPITKALDDIGGRLNLALFDLTSAERQNFQKRHGLLRLLVAFNILYYNLGFAILSDDQGLPLFHQVSHDLRGMGLEIADWFDLAGELPLPPPSRHDQI